MTPAAEAIWKAYCKEIGYVSIYTPHDVALGAALRALADQVVPEEPRPDPSQGFTRLCTWEQRSSTRLRLLAIADELDWQGVPPDGTTGTEP